MKKSILVGSIVVLALGAFAPVELAAQEPATAQIDEAARRLAEKMLASYLAADSYYLRGEIVMVQPTLPDPMIVPFELAVEKPTRVLARRDHSLLGHHYVSNDEGSTTYAPSLNQYVQSPSRGVDPTTVVPIPIYGIPLDGEDPLGKLLNGVHELRLLENRTVSVGESEFDAPGFALEIGDPAAGPAGSTLGFYLHPATHQVLAMDLVRRQLVPGSGEVMESSAVLSLDEQSLGEALEPSLFVFDPPEGAALVAQFSQPGQGARPDLTGEPARDFVLNDLDGNEVKLADLRGKVVLMDFWASWCGPCKMELPHIQKLHEEFAEKGLIVFGVNSEPAEKARLFLQRNPLSFPTLVDLGGMVSGLYQVMAIPTVVLLDEEGTIATYAVGYQSEEKLRAALAGVGLE